MVAVLLACSLLVPTDCRQHEMPLDEVTPVMQWLEAQSRAADWLKDHPGLEMRGLSVVRGRAA